MKTNIDVNMNNLESIIQTSFNIAAGFESNGENAINFETKVVGNVITVSFDVDGDRRGIHTGSYIKYKNDKLTIMLTEFVEAGGIEGLMLTYLNNLTFMFKEYINVKYYLCEAEQDGDGCDYSIKCGTNVIKMESVNFNDSVIELSKLMDEHLIGDFKLSKATIYEVTDTLNVDVDKIYKNIENDFNYIKNLNIEKEERKLLKKLKEKYEK